MKTMNLNPLQVARLFVIMDKGLKRKDIAEGGACVGVDYSGNYEPLGRCKTPAIPKQECIESLIGFLSWDASRGENSRDRLIAWMDKKLPGWFEQIRRMKSPENV